LLKLLDIFDYLLVPFNNLGGNGLADLFYDFPDNPFVLYNSWLYRFDFGSHFVTSLIIYQNMKHKARGLCINACGIPYGENAGDKAKPYGNHQQHDSPGIVPCGSSPPLMTGAKNASGMSKPNGLYVIPPGGDTRGSSLTAERSCGLLDPENGKFFPLLYCSDLTIRGDNYFDLSPTRRNFTG
jgi:hypothetical protein